MTRARSASPKPPARCRQPYPLPARCSSAHNSHGRRRWQPLSPCRPKAEKHGGVGRERDSGGARPARWTRDLDGRGDSRKPTHELRSLQRNHGDVTVVAPHVLTGKHYVSNISANNLYYDLNSPFTENRRRRFAHKRIAIYHNTKLFERPTKRKPTKKVRPLSLRAVDVRVVDVRRPKGFFQSRWTQLREVREIAGAQTKAEGVERG